MPKMFGVTLRFVGAPGGPYVVAQVVTENAPNVVFLPLVLNERIR
jgi:hypothetical protein